MSGAQAPARRNAGFWIGAIVGLAFVLFGVADLLHQSGATDPPGLALWFGGAGIAHDAVIAPAVVLVGCVTRRLPAAARVPVRLGAAATGLLTLLVWPLVQGWGANDALPSALPLDYGHNLAVALVTIWAVVAVAVVTSARRA